MLGGRFRRLALRTVSCHSAAGPLAQKGLPAVTGKLSFTVADLQFGSRGAAMISPSASAANAGALYAVLLVLQLDLS
jgi:hypothetical protein